MLNRRLMLAAGLALGAGAPVLAGSRTLASPLLSDQLSALLAGAQTAGGFVAAARSGRLVSFHPWGRASHAFDVPVTARTLYHLGSNGKQFTGLAVQQLVEAGRVRPDDLVSRHVPGLPAAWSGVRVRHCLHQTSGLPDYLDADTAWDRPLDRTAFLRLLSSKPLLFQPDQAWSYSNTNYPLLVWLIEEVSGLTYPEHLARNLFRRASTPLVRPDASEAVIAGRAEPYNYVDGALRHAVRMQNEISSLPDGGVLFSASDLAPWQAGLDGARLVSRAGLRAIRSPAPLTTGRQAPYGYGHYLDRTRGRLLLWHAGYVPGFPSYWMSIPDLELSVLACTNSDGPNGANLPAMALAAAEHAAPGSTYASLPRGAPADRKAERLAAFLFRGASAPEPGLLAPELAVLDPGALNRAGGERTALAPLERYPVTGGEMVRYRLGGADAPRHRLAGWTPSGQLFWISN